MSETLKDQDARMLAVVTARGGSKRLPGKNMRLLGGKPLVLWSIETALQAARICDVLVSTDDPAIADAARSAGVLVPWLRPSLLGGDETPSADVCIHALDWYEAERGVVDGLVLLQPTSPFRRRATIERGIDLFCGNGRRPIVAVSNARSHPHRSYRIENDGMRPFTRKGRRETRAQQLEPAYAVNGALYVVSPSDLRKRRSFYGSDMLPLILSDPAEAIDIDTEWDWMIAETVLARCAAQGTNA